jgi:hypothetical protein
MNVIETICEKDQSGSGLKIVLETIYEKSPRKHSPGAFSKYIRR